MNKETILSVKNLSVTLGNEKIINNLSFEVNKGDFLTVLGPNGSGKTVLIKTLLGLIKPDTGDIIWRSDKIGYLPQGLTPLKLKGLPLSAKEFLSLKKLSDKEISEMIKYVGLERQILNKQIENLSGGQFQRLLMTWVLAKNPEVVLLDEPTVGVDAPSEKSAYELLLNLQKKHNLTIILITHDFNIVYKHSNNVICMNKNDSCQINSIDKLSQEKLEEIYGMPIKFYEHNHH